MSRLGLGVCLVALLVCPPLISYAGDNPAAKLAPHLVASAEYLDCPQLAPAACDSINVDLSVEEILAAGGYGYVLLVAYDIESVSGLEFAIEGWPTGRGAPLLSGPFWCADRLTLGDHLDGGGISSFGSCMEPDSSGIAALAYWTFGPLDSADLPINLSIVPSTFTDDDSLLYVMDCTVGYEQDDVAGVSGCTIGGIYSGDLPDCPEGDQGREGGESPQANLEVEPVKIAATVHTGDSAVLYVEVRNRSDAAVSYGVSPSAEWIEVGQSSGVLEAQDSTALSVLLRAPQFPSGRYEGEIRIQEGRGGEATVRVMLSTLRRAVKGHCGSVENEYVEGQILFKVGPGVTDEDVRPTVSEVGGVVIQPIDRLGWGVAEVPSWVDQDMAMEALQSTELIAAVARNWVFYLRSWPTDPLYPQQWSLNHTAENSPEDCVPGSDIDMPGGWEITHGSPDVLIGVVDTGIAMDDGELCHPDLDDPERILIGGNYTSQGDPGDVADPYGHGTHVTGIAAAAADNDSGIVGVCPECKVMVFKAADTGESCSTGGYSAMVAAVAAGVDVINFSAGTYCDDWGEMQWWEEAIADAYAHDCIVVNAISNDGYRYWNGFPEILAICGTLEGHECGYPNMIPVAASDCTDQLAGFSGWGPMVGVVAPGGTGPFQNSGADDILSDWRSSDAAPCPEAYFHNDGCSMAAPHVTGLVGLIRSLRPELTAEEVRDIIFCTTDQIDSENYPYEEGTVCWDWEEETGEDMGPLVCGESARYRNEHYGFGRINAQQALELAASYAAVEGDPRVQAGEGALELSQNRPNPFNPDTEVRFCLPSQGEVRLSVYNVRGQKVRCLMDAAASAGSHSIVWDGRDDAGRPVQSGIYFLQLRFGGSLRTAKIVLLE